MADERDPGGEVLRVDFGAKARRDQRDEPVDLDDVELTPEQEAAAKAKVEAFTGMVDRGMVMVTFDARQPGVRVPSHLAGELQLALNFSHKFFLEDFAYDERGIRGSLSFQGQPFYCVVPWPAVWMLRSHVDGELLLVPGDVPPELRAGLAAAAAELEAVALPEGSPFSVEPPAPEAPVDGDSDAASDDATDGDDGDDGDDQPPRPGLRLVKK